MSNNEKRKVLRRKKKWGSNARRRASFAQFEKDLAWALQREEAQAGLVQQEKETERPKKKQGFWSKLFSKKSKED